MVSCSPFVHVCLTLTHSWAYSAQANAEEAVPYLKRALELDPEYCLPLVSLGDIAMNSADFESAIGNYSAAYRLSPKHNRGKEVPRSLAKLGLQMARNGEYKDAATFLEIAHELKPPTNPMTAAPELLAAVRPICHGTSTPRDLCTHNCFEVLYETC